MYAEHAQDSGSGWEKWLRLTCSVAAAAADAASVRSADLVSLMATVLYGPRDLTQLPAQARPKPGTHAQTHVCQPASIGRHPCALS